MQWGTTPQGDDNTEDGGLSVTFPIDFPNNCFNIVTSVSSATSANPNIMTWSKDKSRTGFTIVYDTTGTPTGEITGNWQAIGN